MDNTQIETKEENKISQSTRRPVFDYIRLIACFGIIGCHVIMDRYDLGGATMQGIARICLPIFFLMSGSLILTNKREEAIGKFYLKRVEKILIPFLFYGLYYSCWINKGHKILEMPHKASLVEAIRYLPQGLLDNLREPVYYHLWFMYALVGFYLFAPFLRKGLQALTQKDICVLLAVILFMAAANVYLPYLGIGFGVTNYIFTWLMYPIFGYAMLQIKSKKSWWIVFGCGLVTLLLTIIWKVQAGSAEKIPSNYYDLSPQMVIQTCGMFALFMLIEKPLTKSNVINKIVRWLSGYTFSIYMIHGYIVLYYLGVHPGITESFGGVVKSILMVFAYSLAFSVIVDNIIVKNLQRLFHFMCEGIHKMINTKRVQAISE